MEVKACLRRILICAPRCARLIVSQAPAIRSSSGIRPIRIAHAWLPADSVEWKLPTAEIAISETVTGSMFVEGLEVGPGVVSKMCWSA